jgi:hypothetical protein
MSGKHCHLLTCKYHPQNSESFPEDGSWELRSFFESGDGKIAMYFCSTEHLIEWLKVFAEKERRKGGAIDVVPLGHNHLMKRLK